MPHRFSDRIGFFLCGIADEPFWPLPNASVASPTSVRCQWRTVTASRSTAVPSTRQREEEGGVAVARDHLRRTTSGRRPSDAERRCLDGGLQVARRCRPRPRSCRPRSPARAATSAALRAPELGVPAREHQPGGDRLGVDAVRAADHGGRAVLLGATAAGGPQQVDAGQDLDRPPRRAGWRATRPARPTTSCPGAASAPARPPAPRRASGTR